MAFISSDRLPGFGFGAVAAESPLGLGESPFLAGGDEETRSVFQADDFELKVGSLAVTALGITEHCF